jgi:hypothetical protein
MSPKTKLPNPPLHIIDESLRGARGFGHAEIG